MIHSEQQENGTSVLRTSQSYNANNQLTGQSWQMGSTAYSEGYTHNSADGSLNTMTTGVGSTLTMGYDGLRRLTSVSGGPVARQFAYRDIDSTKTTLQVASVTSGGQKYSYTYDSMGNIATYAAPGKGTVTYTYDNQGQLLSAVGDTTYTYTYDGAGNILTASNGTTSHTYTYGDADWKDLLTAFDGNSITYDAIGNPTSYYNGTRWNFSWENGRSLATASDGTNSLSFAYDADGLRTRKTVNGTTYHYYYASGKLMRMTWGANTIDFFYDANGVPYALKYNGTAYYYITNLQGDVMRIVNASGTVFATYEYDPYGKVVSATGTLANVNPLRYRGYVYDQETGFYYLLNRYYDPFLGRFINSDVFVSARYLNLICNMFAYCINNPVNFLDANGFDAIWIQEEGNAHGMGHTGLMVQDEAGDWFYFYWGPHTETPNLDLLKGTPTGAYIVNVGCNNVNLRSTEAVKAALGDCVNYASSSDAMGTLNDVAERSKDITSTFYFEGDYTATYSEAQKMISLKESNEYNLLSNNCVQNTLRAFIKSDSRFVYIQNWSSVSGVVPNVAAGLVSLLPTRKGALSLLFLITYAFRNRSN